MAINIQVRRGGKNQGFRGDAKQSRPGLERNRTLDRLAL
jgi:hypothetical protein